MNNESKATVEQAEEMRALRRGGAKVVEIARRYSMHVASVRDILKDRMHRRLVTAELTSESWARLEAVQFTREQFVARLVDEQLLAGR